MTTGYHIVLNFTTLHLKKHRNFVLVYDGPSFTAKLLSNVSSDDVNGYIVTSTSNIVLVNYKADISNIYRGFLVSYKGQYFKPLSLSQKSLSGKKVTLTISAELQQYAERLMEDKIGSVVHITESIVHIAQETATGTEEVAASASQLSAGMANYIEKSNELNDISIKLKRELSSFKLS